jgi:hypothetical protein
VALDDRQSPTPQRAPFDQRLVSAAEARPQVEAVPRPHGIAAEPMLLHDLPAA